MYIHDITINRFVCFKFSNIKQFIWNTIGSISIILGRNGSGKSSLLSACLPLPQVRSMFDKGSIRTELEHRGDEYIISSDYTEQHSPHSFILNGVEQNISGTTKIQQELVEQYLGITPTISKILTIGVKFCELTPSDRKTLLSELNPANTTLALDKHRLVMTKLKAVKSNLVLLYKRKEQIASKLMKPELLDAIRTNKNTLLQKKELLVSWIYTLHPHISMLQQHQKPCIVDINTVLNTLHQINVRSELYTKVDRDNYLTLASDYKSTIAVISSKIFTLEEDLGTIVRDLSKYESYLTDNRDEAKDLLVQKITELEDITKSIEIDTTTFIPVHISKLEVCKEHYPKLHELLSKLIDIEVPIPTEDMLESLHTNLYKLTEALDYSKNRLDALQGERAELYKKIDNYKVELPADCLTDRCNLHKRYYSFIQQHKDRIDIIDQEVTELTEKYNKYKDIKETAHIHYEKNKYSRYLYKEVMNYVGSYMSGITEYIREIPMEKYHKHPLGISGDIKQYIANSELYWTKVKTIGEIQALQKQLLQIQEDKKPPIEFITKLIDEKRKELSTKRDLLEKLYTKLKSTKEDLMCIERYIVDKNYIEDTISEIKNYDYQLEIQGSITYYQDILSILERTISSIDGELSDLTTIVEEQDDLISRLNSEILSMIDELVEEQRKYAILEQALSPTTGFPYKYTVRFTNNLINNMNVFIRKVFTYPLYIKKITEGEDLTYRFNVLVGDTEVSDISLCSDGQKAIINMAFCLAVIVQLKLTDYPLFLDEVDRELDSYHKQELLSLLSYLLSQDLCKQIFIVGHDATVRGLSGDQIHIDTTIPNEHVQYVCY